MTDTTKPREHPAMTDIKDNPPPLPGLDRASLHYNPDTDDLEDCINNLIISERAAAFERGKAAMQAEVVQARRDALEEAAKTIESMPPQYARDVFDAAYKRVAEEGVAKIRALGQPAVYGCRRETEGRGLCGKWCGDTECPSDIGAAAGAKS